uniref:ATP synthase complex subunit 8 n=1 Tax=Climacia areolaris TaxID=560896 RepID=A0A1S5QYQ3_9NEOP|nr:ATP synthase F0 subunit 8 [Climacia areolaris]
MPQMAPINWLTLFMYFTLLMIIFNSLNYFIFLYKVPSFQKQFNKLNSLNWKW